MEEQFKTLIILSHYLKTGRFRQLWDEAAKSRHIVEACQATNSGWILEKGHGSGQLVALLRNEFSHPELKKSAAGNVPLELITR
ncbi:hypothetical protein CRYUN_Cryun05aG0060700 [Craigia yunnanensis]